MFGSALIGYWPGNEESGTVAVDYSGNGYNGVYTGVTLGQEGIGDGLTCPLYDGTNDYMQPPAGFRTAFNGLEGSLLLWFRVFNSGVWTDGIGRQAAIALVDGTNRLWIQKSATNNLLSFVYTAGGTSKSVTRAATTTTGWVYLAMTWSASADQFIAYYAGLQTGATQTGLGTWVGVPVAAQALIGAFATTPSNVTNGWIQHALCLNRAATPAEVAAAAAI